MIPPNVSSHHSLPLLCRITKMSAAPRPIQWTQETYQRRGLCPLPPPVQRATDRRGGHTGWRACPSPHWAWLVSHTFFYGVFGVDHFCFCIEGNPTKAPGDPRRGWSETGWVQGIRQGHTLVLSHALRVNRSLRWPEPHAPKGGYAQTLREEGLCSAAWGKLGWHFECVWPGGFTPPPASFAFREVGTF